MASDRDVTEEWRKVFDGNYEVSSLGRFRRATPGRKTWPGRISSPIKMKIGYLEVRPTVNGKNVQVYLHRLVAEVFIGPCPEGFEINHKDGNKANSALSNLEYVSHAENTRHSVRTGLTRTGEKHPRAKLSDADVADIRESRAKGESGVSVARRLGVSQATVCQIWKNQRRK